MAESVTQKLKRKKMSSNNTRVEEVSGCIIGLGIRSGNKTGGVLQRYRCWTKDASSVVGMLSVGGIVL